MPLIVTPENLREAFWKARKGKDGQPEVEALRENLDDKLIALRNELLEGEVRVGEYHYFTIYDPKERVICAASFRERVLHHALMNVCHPVFERFQLDCSYATRPKKGTYAALEKARSYNARYRWFLKLDVRKFFDSIDHEVLLGLLRRKIKDKQLLDVFGKIVGSYSVAPGKGLPIGNLTSQYFANYYLAFLDHFVKEQLQHRPYVRYMDDMVLWSNDKRELQRLGKEVASYLRQQLKLELKIYQLNRAELGLHFLGYRLHDGEIRLAGRSKRRFKKKMLVYHAKLARGEWNQADFQAHVLPLLAYVQKAKTASLRAAVLADVAVRYPGRLPRHPWRQLEQQPSQLPRGQSQQQRTDEP
jgi:retron-type reverse transcriptase